MKKPTYIHFDNSALYALNTNKRNEKKGEKEEKGKASYASLRGIPS